MSYLYLLIAIFSGAAKGYCGKRTSGRIAGWHNAILANFVRMLLCVAIGFCTVAAGGLWNRLRPDAKALGIYFLSGASTALFLVTWLIAVRTSAYVLMNVFLMLGTVVPMTLGCLCYSEVIQWNHWLGLGVLLAATLILCSYNNGIKQKMTFKGFAVMLLSGIANGITNFSQKMFRMELPGGEVPVFNFYTYVFAALILGTVMLPVRKNKEEQSGGSVLGSIFGYLLAMAIFLFLNSYFMTTAAAGISSSVLYPLERGAGIILSAVVSAVCFKEKLTPKAIVGLILAFIGLLVINLL